MHQSRLTVVPLSSLTRKPGEIQNFGAYSLCNLIEWVQDGIPFVKVENYSEFGIDWSSVKHITPDVHKVLFKSKLKKGDTLLSMAGTIGISIVFDGEFQANSNQAIAKIRLSDPRIEPRFLSEFLNSDIGRLQSARISNGAVQANINLGEIGTIEVPIVSKSEQDKLVAAMDSARVSRQAKLAEADALLAGLDSFLLDTLGLAPPPRDERRVFAATVCQVREQSHLNADYFHPERILPLREMKAALPHGSAVRLAEAVDFIREQIKTPGPNYLSLAHVQSHTGELADANEEATGACSKVSKGDVLFARLRPYLNKVYCAEMNGCCSPEFHVLRVRDTNALRPDYLAAILRSSLTLTQTRHMMTGNTHPRLTNEDVVNLIIPIPKKLAVQESVVTESQRRREQARRLRLEAEAEWQATKRWFEEQLLGPANHDL